MSASPRVLLCCEHYPPSIGGVQEVMRQIAERLASDGVNVTVATSLHPDRNTDTIRNGARVKSFAISGNLIKGIRGPVVEYQRFLLEGNFDAILIKAAQQWTFDAAIDILPRIQSRKLFIPCGFSSLSDPLYKRYFNEMSLWLRLFDGLIFYSSDYQDIKFAKQHKLSKIHVLPNGADEREFEDLDPGDIRERIGINLEADLLISVGSRIASKGHWEVISAFRQADLERPTTLIINANNPGGRFLTTINRHLKHAATGKMPLPILAWRYNRTLSRKHIIITDLNRHDVVSLYKAADLFLSASHAEYSPLVLFEAAAAGTPFIASDAGNSREIADWTSGGIVYPKVSVECPERSISYLVKNMENLLRNKKRLEIMGKTARNSVLTKGFTWNYITRQYRRLLLD